MSIIAFTCFFYDAGVNDITFQRSSGVVEDGLIGFTCRLQGSVFGNIEWLFGEELLFGSKIFLDDETVAVIALYFCIYRLFVCRRVSDKTGLHSCH